MCQITYFFGKRPELSQKMSRTTFFKARYNFFLAFLKFFLFTISVTLKMTIKKYFFEKKVDFQFFFWQFFFYEFHWRIFLRHFFQDFFFRNCHFDSNAYGELNFFQKFQKKFRSGLKKHCSGCFLKQLGSFSIQASILTYRFHTQ